MHVIPHGTPRSLFLAREMGMVCPNEGDSRTSGAGATHPDAAHGPSDEDPAVVEGNPTAGRALISHAIKIPN